MAAPSRNTLTFLFTDIEESTALAQDYPDALPSLLARHRQILNESITARNGQVFRIIGDAFCAAFQTVSDAVQAALEAQQKLQHEQWSHGAIRVRMGIHSGVVSPGDLNTQDDSYLGYLTLTRTQRIMSVAHGGQILLSAASAELLRDQLPQTAVLRDLGKYPLKGLAQPEQLWQIAGPDLTTDFPPLSARRTIPNNLPVSITSFIGREREIKEVRGFLKNIQLITLTGPGGTGKTRLALQVAGEVLEQYEDGVWLVEFAPLADPSLVPQMVATALGIRELPGRSVMTQLTDYLHAKKALIVLDNCEHLVEACAHLVDTLLHTCPSLQLMATSREALGITGETSYPVPPLQMPDLTSPTDKSLLIQNESIRLFIERAKAVSPRFALSDTNAEPVAQICRRLDGIPLAIELAAVRIRLFTPEQIVERLDDRFRLLTGGSRTALPRQQTLWALIEWSYDLLSQAERRLMEFLSVFSGGGTYDAIEYVCAGASAAGELSTYDILDALAQLVNKSLVIAEQQGDQTRYLYLETIRQFAHEKLLAGGEVDKIRTRHLDYYLTLAQTVEPQLHGVEQISALDRLTMEGDNLRAAQRWALESNQDEKGLALAGALWYFWYIRDHFAEAQKQMSQVLDHSVSLAPAENRLKVMNGLGFLYYAASNMSKARALLVESANIAQQLASTRRRAEALQYLGAIEIAEAPSSSPDQLVKIQELFEQCLALWQELDDKTGISWELNQLAGLAQMNGDLPKARDLWEQSVKLRRLVGDPFLLAYSLRRLADLALQQGDISAAEAGYREGHQLLEEVRGKGGIAASLASFAGLALAKGQVVRAVRLFGAAKTLLEDLAWQLPPADNEVYVSNLSKAHTQLSEGAFELAWNEGGSLSLEQAIAYALNKDVDPQGPSSTQVW